ncbi:hypothetical protein B0H16DRAFT_1458856 [Mycena metata]|uniref:Uncharacterized protein n=1 Tax=Mycena metata TaxID=1033252 RepID=A0AAD7J5B5_9AGAR|nr:hypothetical protein B0H16DRAFT_1458856 [Mycena metata]
MPRPSKKSAAARNNWDKALGSIKAGTKRALSILTPRKKNRKIETEKENETETIYTLPPSEDAANLPSPTASCPDDEFFLSPGPKLPRALDDLSSDARAQFGLFHTNTHVSPSKSSSLGRIWHDFTPRLLGKLSPSRKSVDSRVFNDNESILAQRSRGPVRMLGDTSNFDSDQDSLDFELTLGPASFISSINPRESVDFMSLRSADSRSIDSMSLKEMPTPLPTPTSTALTDAELAERARLREAAVTAADGSIRAAPTGSSPTSEKGAGSY